MAERKPTRKKVVKKRTAKQEGPSLESLFELSDEMNEIMGLEPALDIDDDTPVTTAKEMILAECIDEDGICQIWTTDTFSEKALATLAQLGVTPVDPETEEDPEEPEQQEEDQEEEPEESDDVDIPSEEKIKKMKKSGLLKVVEDTKLDLEFDDYKTIPAFKQAILEELYPDDPEEPEQQEEESEKPKKDTKAPKKKPTTKTRYTRSSAFGEAVAETGDNPITIDELAANCDEIYCEKTGEEDASNMRESKWITAHGLNVLAALDLVDVIDGMVTYKG